jgi:transcriptional regulator with GAF, ATPase, and Fis domain
MHSFPDQPWAVQQVRGGAEALERLENGDWQCLFVDRELPDLDAEELKQIVKRRFPTVHVVAVDSAAQTVLRAPHSDIKSPSTLAPPPTFVAPTGPFLLQERVAAKIEIKPLPGMIGNSQVMQHLYRLVRLVAARSTTVLIVGPTGTGKELVARALHQLSPRCGNPFVVVNCAAIPEALLESELFGYVRGAFTGAVQAYSGRIHAAQGGTLFLDEVGELPLNLQSKLLRFLDQKEIQRLGSAESLRVDVRVVAATNVELARETAQRRFREDLYYRLSAFPLELPPLDQRLDDIALLSEHFLRLLAVTHNAPTMILDSEALRILQSHTWGGNVRELQQVIERAAILADGHHTILPEHIRFSPNGQEFLGAIVAARKEQSGDF